MVEHELNIDTFCKKSLPCKHSVTFPSGECVTMRGNEIYKIIPTNHSMYDHFKKYDEWNKNAEQRRMKGEEYIRKCDEKRAE